MTVDVDVEKVIIYIQLILIVFCLIGIAYYEGRKAGLKDAYCIYRGAEAGDIKCLDK